MNWKPNDHARVRKDIDHESHLKWVLGLEVVLMARYGTQNYWIINFRTPQGKDVIVHEQALEPLTPLGNWNELAIALGTDIRTRKPIVVREPS